MGTHLRPWRALVACAVVAGCGGGGDESTTAPPAPAPAPPPATTAPTPDARADFDAYLAAMEGPQTRADQASDELAATYRGLGKEPDASWERAAEVTRATVETYRGVLTEFEAVSPPPPLVEVHADVRRRGAEALTTLTEVAAGLEAKDKPRVAAAFDAIRQSNAAGGPRWAASIKAYAERIGAPLPAWFQRIDQG